MKVSRVLIVGTAFLLAGCTTETTAPRVPTPTPASTSLGTDSPSAASSISEFNDSSLLTEVISTPVFAGFGHLIFPDSQRIPPDMTVSDVSRLLPYHSNVNSSEVAETLNTLVADASNGKLSWQPVYSEDAVAADPEKANVGLFFFAGNPDAPFAIISPGGGFSYVGSVHEGFPYAQALSARGHNAFVLNYRVGGGGLPATQDLAQAIDYVFANSESLGVSTKDYSLWGSSAGARMAANIGSHGTERFGVTEHARPATVIMAYTGHTDYTNSDPATFAVVGSNDGIASPTVMEQRISNLQRAGIDAQFVLYEGVGHGFGLGTGTPAEGWIDGAIEFWEAHMD